MMGALSNAQTKIAFAVGRPDSEKFTKIIGRVDSEAGKRDPKTDTQRELVEPIANQWEQGVDHIRLRKLRHAVVARLDGSVAEILTITIPPHTARDDELEDFERESLKRYGIPYSEVIKNLEKPAYEDPVAVSGPQAQEAADGKIYELTGANLKHSLGFTGHLIPANLWRILAIGEWYFALFIAPTHPLT